MLRRRKTPRFRGAAMDDVPALPEFRAPYAPPDEARARQLLADPPSAALRATTRTLAADLLAAVRAGHSAIGGVEDFLREFSLSSREGVAVMTLAESLLRAEDDFTADSLIADRLAAGDFSHHAPSSNAPLVQACAFALGVSARLFGSQEAPQTIVADLTRRLGAPALRAAARASVKLMGAHFVFGETIEAALLRAQAAQHRAYRFSFDMLGESARSGADAEVFFNAYAQAIEALGASPIAARGGVSVKLSALHPLYAPLSRERALDELPPRLLALARAAKKHGLQLTVDAEEAERLELSLKVFARVAGDASLRDWDGFGIAVQAYQKRAHAVIDHMNALAAALRRRFTIRLVKGAYWDSEIKRAQERGLDDYPVFTRKAMSDLNYLACADALLRAPALHPQFATHNVQTAAAVLARAGARRDFEFQRLHGMGEALHEALRARHDAPVRIYAPVGPHRDLLAYLVRRLIENGANSSFVARVADPATPDAELIAEPVDLIASPEAPRSSRIPSPRDLFAPARRNSRGIAFGERAALDSLLKETDAHRRAQHDAAPSAGVSKTAPRDCHSPIDGARLGAVVDADADCVDACLSEAARAFFAFTTTPVETRAQMLERAADLIEARRGALIALLQGEAGKTLDDALAEIREAADFCRYYAVEARRLCAPRQLPGVAGEENVYARVGRGVFLCISPWNFPLAIFIGQVAAALAAGNAVVAKPAEQTPLIAALTRALLLDAGVPAAALQLAPGDGAIGAALVKDPRIAGIAFTGSLPAAHAIHRARAEMNTGLIPIIAETGGVNAMIVDQTALPEQVVDDVLASAFRSAGQRCSALRLLCAQDDIAETLIARIIGALREWRVGDPRDIATQIGPVIDAEARKNLLAYLAQALTEGRILYAGDAPAKGCFVAPHIVRIDHAIDLRDEIFGPVLHVVSWRAEAFEALLETIAGTGYGLTLGVQTRMESRIRAVAARAPAGNVYINRNMIGAVVGSQPFGGFGLSGTGPKAGGNDYLRRFVKETTLTINTAAFGGDTQLLSSSA
jgi:RHH-type transcriptional regulator, proline utilization regulon repressor / proline dehydrogenase / delta 1-pyrroline-5-carboxylate dehydrogenase